MKTWNVCVTFDCSHVVEVQAETKEAAMEKAMLEADAYLCSQCSEDLTLGDPVEAVDAWEVESES